MPKAIIVISRTRKHKESLNSLLNISYTSLIAEMLSKMDNPILCQLDNPVLISNKKVSAKIDIYVYNRKPNLKQVINTVTD